MELFSAQSMLLVSSVIQELGLQSPCTPPLFSEDLPPAREEEEGGGLIRLPALLGREDRQTSACLFRSSQVSLGKAAAGTAGCQHRGGWFAASSHPGHNMQEMPVWSLGGGGETSLSCNSHSTWLGCSDPSCEEPGIPSPGPWEQDQGRMLWGRQQSHWELPSSTAGCQLCTEPQAPTAARTPQLQLRLRSQVPRKAVRTSWGAGRGKRTKSSGGCRGDSTTAAVRATRRSGRHLPNDQPNSLSLPQRDPFSCGA